MPHLFSLLCTGPRPSSVPPTPPLVWAHFTRLFLTLFYALFCVSFAHRPTGKKPSDGIRTSAKTKVQNTSSRTLERRTRRFRTRASDSSTTQALTSWMKAALAAAWARVWACAP